MIFTLVYSLCGLVAGCVVAAVRARLAPPRPRDVFTLVTYVEPAGDRRMWTPAQYQTALRHTCTLRRLQHTGMWMFASLVAAFAWPFVAIVAVGLDVRKSWAERFGHGALAYEHLDKHIIDFVRRAEAQLAEGASRMRGKS